MDEPYEVERQILRWHSDLFEKLTEVDASPNNSSHQQLRLISEKLTFKLVNESFADALDLAKFGSGRPDQEDVMYDEAYAEEGGYSKVVKVIAEPGKYPVTAPNPASLIVYGEWKYNDFAVKAVQYKPSDTVPEWRLCLRYVREVIIGSSLKHENIVPFLGLWPGFYSRYSPLPGIVCPWFEGNLASHLKEDDDSFQQSSSGKFTPMCTRLKFLSEILSALNYMHKHRFKISHGDIKASNILLRNGSAYLCDFGLSRIQDIFTGLSTSSETNIRWMAPERCFEEMRNATPESDMYEFGTTFWEVVEGKAPWSWISSGAVYIRKRSKEILPRPSNIPDEVWAFVLTCMDPDPLQRINSSKAMERLKSFVDGGVDWPVSS